MLCGVFIRTLRTKNNCQSVTDGLEIVAQRINEDAEIYS
jgi:hypothetical protein